MPLRSTDVSSASVGDYRECAAAIRKGSRSFYAASWLLPPAVRRPAIGLYAFCRLSDDAIDLGEGHRDAIERLRNRLSRAGDGRPLPFAADREMAALMRRYAIPRAVPEALLEGLAWDAEGRTYETLGDLLDYAARVAGSVGVMMALIMGASSPEALARACDLGIAMQLTNIARDVGEDAKLGRLYLPKEWLRESGVDEEGLLAEPAPSEGLRIVVARLLGEAQTLYSRARSGIARLPAGCRLAILAAALIYAEIGREVERNNWDCVNVRARVSRWRKVQILLGATTQFAWARRGQPRPALECARFLLDAVREGPSVPARAIVPIGDWRESFIGVLGTFERLQRAERLGD